LSEENSTFNSSIDDFQKELEIQNVDDSLIISTMNSKLQNLKLHMENINRQIQYLKNFIKDDTPQNQLIFLNKIKTSFYYEF